MKTLLSFFLLLAACSSAPRKMCPTCVEKTAQDPFGLLTVKAPDTAGFESMPRQSLRLYVECQYKTINKKNEEQPDLSKSGQKTCQQMIGKILMAKGFVLLPAVDSSSERWVFRFEENREEFGDVKVITAFTPAQSTHMWGTLTRFKGKTTTPYYHHALMGWSHFERQSIRIKPADQLSLIVDQKSLLDSLLKSLAYNAIQNPNGHLPGES